MLREASIDDELQARDDLAQDDDGPLLSNNDDLKEFCILLDEERYKMHQLAEQWKHFGTSTIHKLESQILDYQEKLGELEQRQLNLLQENDALKARVDQSAISTANQDSQSKEKKCQHKHVSTQTSAEKPESLIDKLSLNMSIDDPLQQQISLQNMFDAIKTAEVYESIDHMKVDDASEKTVLKEFCNLIWKYLEERSKPKSSCLL